MLKKWTNFSAALMGAALSQTASAQITINELDSSTVQTSANTEAYQFVELKGPAGASLDGYTLVFVNGASNRIYRTVSLDGWKINGNGLFVVGNPGVPKVDLVLPLVTPNLSIAGQTSENNDTIQPGPDAVVVVKNPGGALFNPVWFLEEGPSSAFPIRSGRSVIPGTTGNFQEQGVSPISALVYQSSADMPVEADLLNTFQNVSAARSPTGLPIQVHEGERAVGDNYAHRLSDSVALVGNAWLSAQPTPGEENKAAGGVMPTWPTVGYTPPPSSNFAISEINGHIFSRKQDEKELGDANDDGLADDKDQFVEIVNVSAGSQDLSGLRLYINAGLAHVFNPGTWLRPGQAIVVFKGGVKAEETGITNKFGNAIVVNACASTATATAEGEREWELAGSGTGIVRLVNAGGNDVTGTLFHALEGGSMADLDTGNDTLSGGLFLDQRFGHQWKRATSGLPTGFVIDSPLADQLPVATGIDQIIGARGAGAAQFQGGHPFFSPGAKADSSTKWLPVTETLTLSTSAAVSDLKGRNAGKIKLSFPSSSLEDRFVLLAMDRTANTAEGSGDNLKIQDASTVNSAVYSLKYEPNRKYYVVQVPAGGDGSKTLDFQTDPAASATDEVYTFSATSSWAVNTPSSTPAAVRVIKGNSEVTFSRNVVIEGAGSNAAALTIKLPAGKTAPAAITFDIYTGDMNAATVDNAVFDPTLPILPDPATAGSGSRNPALGVVTNPAKGAAPEAAATLTIPAGGTSATVQLNVPEDPAFHDNRFVRFTVIGRQSEADPSQELSFGGTGHLKVVQPLVINEIHGGSDGPGPFIEIVNNSAEWRDLEGYTLSVVSTVVHTFPWGSQLPPGGAAVVFGGGNIEEGNTAQYGTSLVQKASGGLAGLMNATGVTLHLGNNVFNSRMFTAFPGGSEVRRDARDGDGTGLFAAVGHNTAYTPATASSAGVRGTGAKFVDITSQLTLSLDRPSIPELWALPFVPNRGQLTIKRPERDNWDLKLRLFNTLPAAAQPVLPGVPASTTVTGPAPGAVLQLTIPAGQSEVAFPVLPMDTTAGNGNLETGFRFIGGGYLNSGSASLLVRDSGTLDATFRGDEATARRLVESAGLNAAAIHIATGPANSEISLVSETQGPAVFAPSPLTLDAGGAGAVGVGIPSDANTVAVEPDRTQRVVLFSDAAGQSANTLLTVTTVDDGGAVESGPFINEIDYSTADFNFVEISVPAGEAPLSGFSLVVYGADGKVSSATDLTGSATPFLAVGSSAYSLGSTSKKQLVGDFALPASGAVAVYRRPASAFRAGDAVFADLLVDAVVYGAANADLQETLTPGAPAATGSGLPAAAAWAPVTDTTVAGSASRLPDAAATTAPRAPSGFASSLRTPGAPNGTAAQPADKGRVFASWLARFGLSGSDADLNADPDGDGVSNGWEFFSGTSPQDPADAGSWFSLPPQDGKFIPAASAEAAEETGLKRQGSLNLLQWEEVPAGGKSDTPLPVRYFLRILQTP